MNGGVPVTDGTPQHITAETNTSNQGKICRPT